MGDSSIDGPFTTLTLPWIAAPLRLETWKSLNAKLHRWRSANDNQKQ